MVYKNTTLLFYLWKHRRNKKGLCPLYFRSTVNGVRKQRATGIFLSELQWNQEKQKVVKCKLSKLYNSELESIRLKQLLTSSQSHGSLAFIEQGKTDKQKPTHKLLKVFSEYVDYRYAEIGPTYSQGSHRALKASYSYFSKMCKKCKLSQVTLDQLDKAKYQALVNISYTEGYALNTVNKQFKRLKQVLNFAVDKEYIKVNPYLKYSLPKEQKKIEFLTADELELFSKYEPNCDRLLHVRNCFLFCCYTGLAFNELKNLRRQDINEEGNQYWLQIHRSKTKKNYSVPILPQALEILKHYEFILPVISNQKFNAYLKELAELIGLKKRITSHIGRKTFATTVLLGNGVPMDMVSHLLGHSSITITQASYASITQKVCLNSLQKLL